jgi:hypothetical protein
MSTFEEKYLCLVVWGLVGQIVTIGVTIYYYRQLVRNDNRRSQEIEENRIVSWCIDYFRRNGNSHGELQKAGRFVRSRYPNNTRLIIIAIDTLITTGELNGAKTVAAFLNLVTDDKSEHKWPNSYDEAMKLN